LFFKDMAYYIKLLMSPGFMSHFVNTFIIRDPKYALLSLYRMMPDFTLEEAGYEQIYRAFSYAMEAGQDPVVVDGNTFSEDSAGVFSAYCERVGIPFRAEALSWEPREVEEWKNWSWEGWHDGAQWSSGVRRLERREITLPDEVKAAYEYCLPYYHALAVHAISTAGVAQR
jgi:hypothetical protein